MKHDDQTKTQAPSAPQRRLAAVLSFVAPGLGLIYVGRMLAGLFFNLIFVFLLLLFIVALTVFKFFPLYPLLVLLVGWLLLCTLAGWRALEIIDAGEAKSEPAYRHPLIYMLTALLTFVAPVAITASFAAQHLFLVTSVDGHEMYPQAWPGDRLYIDRTAYRNSEPRRGDLVVVRIPETDAHTVARVVGVPSDTIEMHGQTLLINNEPVEYTPLDPAWATNGQLDQNTDFQVLVEHNNQERYVISMLPRSAMGAPVTDLELPPDHFFVLTDNRSAAGDDIVTPSQIDSRILGPINREHIKGSPLYITWSNNPATGQTRWQRIGLPTE